MARFHELVATWLPEDADPSQVLVCIETDRGPWVRALVAAGYRVFGVNPKQAARHRVLLSLSGAKSDKADAHTLADMVRTRRHQLRQVAADTDIAEAVKVVARYLASGSNFLRRSVTAVPPAGTQASGA